MCSAFKIFMCVASYWSYLSPLRAKMNKIMVTVFKGNFSKQGFLFVYCDRGHKIIYQLGRCQKQHYCIIDMIGE